MKNSDMTKEERLQHIAYHRNYRKANWKKIIEINQRYWLKKARELAAEEG